MATLETISSDNYALVGDVSLSDIAGMSCMPEFTEVDEVTVSLAQVASADSAIAALLLQWLRKAEAEGSALKVTDCPDAVRLLLDLYDLESIVGV